MTPLVSFALAAVLALMALVMRADASALQTLYANKGLIPKFLKAGGTAFSLEETIRTAAGKASNGGCSGTSDWAWGTEFYTWYPTQMPTSQPTSKPSTLQASPKPTNAPTAAPTTNSPTISWDSIKHGTWINQAMAGNWPRSTITDDLQNYVDKVFTPYKSMLSFGNPGNGFDVGLGTCGMGGVAQWLTLAQIVTDPFCFLEDSIANPFSESRAIKYFDFLAPSWEGTLHPITTTKKKFASAKQSFAALKDGDSILSKMKRIPIIKTYSGKLSKTIGGVFKTVDKFGEKMKKACKVYRADIGPLWSVLLDLADLARFLFFLLATAFPPVFGFFALIINKIDNAYFSTERMRAAGNTTVVGRRLSRDGGAATSMYDLLHDQVRSGGTVPAPGLLVWLEAHKATLLNVTSDAHMEATIASVYAEEPTARRSLASFMPVSLDPIKRIVDGITAVDTKLDSLFAQFIKPVSDVVESFLAPLDAAWDFLKPFAAFIAGIDDILGALSFLECPDWLGVLCDLVRVVAFSCDCRGVRLSFPVRFVRVTNRAFSLRFSALLRTNSRWTSSPGCSRA
jgi:hypothetical protein